MKEVKPTKRTASHRMLYIILAIYIIVALAGLSLIGICVIKEQYEYIAQVFISEISMVSGCSGISVGFYSNKAKRENELQISNAKYKMRLDLVKEIFAEYGTSLDDKSVDLLRKLMSDENITEVIPTNSPPTATVSMPNVDVTNFIRQNDNEEGLG